MNSVPYAETSKSENRKPTPETRKLEAEIQNGKMVDGVHDLEFLEKVNYKPKHRDFLNRIRAPRNTEP